ncbi:MAG TPA: diguanylate cyclase [Plasticicumulans sp.]|nr:diguanylate cyclase [Plasticicumulans sp.]
MTPAHRALRRLILAFAVLTLIGVGAYWFVLLRDLDTQVETEAAHLGEHAEYRALAAAESLDATLRQLDAVLTGARQDWIDEAGDFDALAQAALRALPPGLAIQLFVIGTDGLLKWSSLGPAPANRLGDRDYFRRLAAAVDDPLEISEPVIGRLTGRWSIQFARRIERHGRFAGVVALSVSPERWARDIEKYAPSDGDSLALFRPDGAYLLRMPDPERHYGQRVPADRPFLGGDPNQHVYTTAAVVDGLVRTYAWRRLDAGPIVVAGIGYEAALAPARAFAQRQILQAVLGTGLLLACAIVLRVLMRRADQATRALAESAERQRAVLSSMAEGVMILAPGGRIEYANAAACRELGLPSERELYHPADTVELDMLRPDGSPMPVEDYPSRRSALSGADFDNELLGRRAADGSVRWFTITTRALHCERSRAPYMVLMTFRDITALRSAEAEARLSQTVFEAAAEGILVTDGEHRIIAANPAFERLSGHRLDELCGQTPQLLTADLPQPVTWAEVLDALATHDGWEGEGLIRRADARALAVLIHVTVLRDGAGRPWRHVALFSDITQRKRREDEAWQRAHYDVLTGLPNRRLLDERLQRALALAEPGRHELAVLFVDLDRFKPVNDVHGHALGDALLERVARRLEAAVREEDTVARYGGDEFVIAMLMPPGAPAAETVAVKLVEQLARPYRLDGRTLEIGASIGIAVQRAGDDAQTLLARADAAMYRAKQAHCGVWRDP